MDELVALIVEKTGLPEETATQVIGIVLEFIKEKLPDPIAGSLDNFLEGDGGINLLSGLGDLFGGKN